METVPLCEQKRGHFTATSEQVHLDGFILCMLN